MTPAERAIGTLKLMLASFEKQATPRRPLKALRWGLSYAIKCCEDQQAKRDFFKQLETYLRRNSEGCTEDNEDFITINRAVVVIEELARDTKIMREVET